MPYQIVSAVHGNCRPQAGPRILLCALVQLEKWAFPSLSSPYWRWYWNDRPGASITLDNQRVDLGPDRIVMIPPLVSFSTFTTGQVTQFYIHFKLAPAYTSSLTGFFQHAAGSSELSLIRQYIARLKGSPDLLEWQASLIAGQLVNAALLTLPENTLIERASHPQIDRAVQLIEAHYPRALPNAKLAKAVAMSPSSFLRQFLRVTGQSPHQYLLARRVEEACRLMHDPTLSLESVAEETGFCDRFHFSRHFKRHMDIGPSQYRRQANLLSGKSLTDAAPKRSG